MKKIMMFVTLLAISTTASAQGLYGFWEWEPDYRRENGQTMDPSELARYEIEGTDTKGKIVLRLSLPGHTTRHSPAAINRAATFTIAACDTKGLCSKRVPLKFVEPKADPKAPRVCI